MDPDAIAIFRELADRSPSEREAYFAQHEVAAGVREEVESLLRFDRPADASLHAWVASAAERLLNETGTLAGQNVGSYTLTSPLGQGGMGSVWLACRSDGSFEGVAAIKLLNAALVGQAAASDSGAKARFWRGCSTPTSHI